MLKFFGDKNSSQTPRPSVFVTRFFIAKGTEVDKGGEGGGWQEIEEKMKDGG